MIDADLFRREPLVYRTGHKRWMLMAPYVSVAFWVATIGILGIAIYLSPVQLPLP